MKNTIRIATVLLVITALANLFSPAAKGQSITGRWYGISEITRAPGYHLSSREEKGDILFLSEDDSGKISGIGYNYYWFRGEFYYYVKNLDCSYDANVKEWIIKETGLRDNHLFSAHYSCLRTYRLKFTKRNQKDSLNGSWTAASFDDCGAGTGNFGRTKRASQTKVHADSITAMLRAGGAVNITNETQLSQVHKDPIRVRKDSIQRDGNSLQREKDLLKVQKDSIRRNIAHTDRDSLRIRKDSIPVRRDSLKVVQKEETKEEAALRQMLARGRKQIQEISLKTPDVKVEIWDNNVIDGDNISLYFNKELIINRKRLTAQPITVNIKVIPGKDNELIMYANNLGEIPPNTAMMRIYADGKEYDVYMSSDENTSGMVKFVLP